MRFLVDYQKNLIAVSFGADFTCDGTHPTDMGYYLMAKKLEPVVRAALEKVKN